MATKNATDGGKSVNIKNLCVAGLLKEFSDQIGLEITGEMVLPSLGTFTGFRWMGIIEFLVVRWPDGTCELISTSLRDVESLRDLWRNDFRKTVAKAIGDELSQRLVDAEETEETGETGEFGYAMQLMANTYVRYHPTANPVYLC